MAKCKWCDKSGLFLSLSKNGLCNTCEIIVVSEVVQAQQHINASTEVIQQSSNTDTIVSRFDFIVEKLIALQRFEKKGIPTLIPPPSKSLEIMTPSERDNHIVYGLEKDQEKLRHALRELKTIKGKNNAIIRFKVRCEDYKNKMLNPILLKEVEKITEHLLDEFKLETNPNN
jgi:hypothetical protein